MRAHHKLVVWQNARILVKEIYIFTKSFPKEETYCLAQQMRRASVSILSNISEGMGRRTKKDMSHFLVMARGSAYELESQLIIANDLQYISKESLKNSIDKTEIITIQLNGLISKYQSKILI